MIKARGDLTEVAIAKRLQFAVVAFATAAAASAEAASAAAAVVR